MKSESLSFRDRFGILLEKRLSSVAGLKYTILYGKSQAVQICAKTKPQIHSFPQQELIKNRNLSGLFLTLADALRDCQKIT